MIISNFLIKKTMLAVFPIKLEALKEILDKLPEPEKVEVEYYNPKNEKTINDYFNKELNSILPGTEIASLNLEHKFYIKCKKSDIINMYNGIAKIEDDSNKKLCKEWIRFEKAYWYDKGFELSLSIYNFNARYNGEVDKIPQYAMEAYKIAKKYYRMPGLSASFTINI